MSDKLRITEPHVRALLEVAAAFFFDGHCDSFHFSNRLYHGGCGHRKDPIDVDHVKIYPTKSDQKTFDSLSRLCEESRIVTYTLWRSIGDTGLIPLVLHVEGTLDDDRETDVDPIRHAE